MARSFGYGLDFVGMALIFSGVMSFASYWWSDKIILTMSEPNRPRAVSILIFHRHRKHCHRPAYADAEAFRD